MAREERATPIEACSLVKSHTENRTHGHVLSNNVYAACAVCVTIFSTGGKYRPVSNFT